MTYLYVLLCLSLFVSSILIVDDWKRGLLICILVGFLQDPVRKLLPGEPVMVSISVGAVLLLTTAVAVLRNVSISPLQMHEWNTRLTVPFSAFLLVLILQCFHTWIRYENFILACVGFMSYMIPFITMVIAYRAALERPDYILRMLKVYTGATIVVSATIYGEYLGLDWSVIGEVGTGIIIYDLGTAFKGMTGLMRSPDIAAWHAGTGIGFFVILFLTAGRSRNIVIGGLIVLAILGAGILTGRRKIILQVLIFLSVYWVLLVAFARGSRRLAGLAIILAILGYALLLSAEQTSQESRALDLYVERGKTVFEDVEDRVQLLGISSVNWAYNRVGFFGAGAGVAAQGARFFREQSFGLEGPAEGGFGKITAELGIPGLLIVLWLMVAMFRVVWRQLGTIAKDPVAAKLACGFIALAGANFIAFVVATQVFGDLFVLTLLGIVIGSFFALGHHCSHFGKPEVSGARAIQEVP